MENAPASSFRIRRRLHDLAEARLSPRLNRITRRKKRKLLTLNGKVNGVNCRILIDSGAEEDFISQNFVEQIAEDAMPTDEVAEMPDGSATPLRLTSSSLEAQIGQLSETKDLFVVDIQSHDVILGAPWLHHHNPRIDWKTGSMLLGNNGSPFVMQAHPQRQPDFLISAKQLNRLAKKCKQPIFAVTAQSILNSEDARRILPPKMQGALNSFADICLEKLPAGLPQSADHDHQIALKSGAEPVSRPICKLTHAELKELRDQLAELLEKGLIAPSKSPWGAPALFAPKASGKLRMRIDCRALNKLTARNQCPLPLPEEIFEKLHGAAVFSKIDLAQGLYQARIDRNSMPLTAFRCRYGRFEWRVAPFGLTNAPAAFMNFMSDVLADHIDNFVLACLGDILARSSSMGDHASHLQQAHQKLKDNRLCCHPQKRAFAKPQVEFLGHIVSSKGVAVDQRKVTAIEEWPAPSAKVELQSFLGLANYCRRLIRKLSHIAKPLTLLTGDAPLKWASTQQTAFDSLKRALTHTPALRCYKPGDKITIHTDASDLAVSGALSQADSAATTRPVAFFSSTLSKAAQSYPPHERELMAVVDSTRHWRACLHGQALQVFSDHNPLEHLFEQKRLSKKQARWLEDLADYDFTISRMRGKENKAADALSRQVSSNPQPSASLLLETARASKNPTMMQLNTMSTTSTMLTDQQRADIMQQRCCDDDFSAMRRPPKTPHSASSGLLCKDNKLRAPQGPFRHTLLASLHDSLTGGHLGQGKAMHAAKQRCFWPTMASEINHYARSCVRRQQSKSLSKRPAEQLRPLQAPQRKWGSISVGFVMPLARAPNGSDGALAVVDRMTKAAALMPIKQAISAEEAAHKFKQEVFRHCGAPGEIISDRDPRLASAFWRELHDIMKAQLAMPTAFHPQADGQAERMSRALEEMARSRADDAHKSWDNLLGDLELARSNSVSAAAGCAPLFLSFGQHPKALEGVALAPPLNSITTDCLQRMSEAARVAQESIEKASIRSQRCVSQHRRGERLSEGDEGLLSTKHIALPAPESATRRLLPKRIGPFAALQKIGELSCKLDLPPALPAHPASPVGKLRRRHQPKGASRAPRPPQPGVFPGGHEEQEVEQIVSHRFRKKTGRLRKGETQRPATLQRLARCKGFDASRDQWMRDDCLENCREIIEECQSRVGATLQ